MYYGYLLLENEYVDYVFKTFTCYEKNYFQIRVLKMIFFRLSEKYFKIQFTTNVYRILWKTSL